MTYLRDPSSGNVAGVTSENRLKVTSVSSSIEHHINHDEGKAFNMIIDVTTDSTDNCFTYIKNLDSDPLTIEGIYIYVGGATDVSLRIGASGTRNAATTILPANLNAGSNNEANGTFETGADLAGGAATLNGTEVTVFKFKFTGETATKFFNFDQDVIIPQNQTITLWSSAVVAIDAMLPFHYHDHEAYA